MNNFTEQFEKADQLNISGKYIESEEILKGLLTFPNISNDEVSHIQTIIANCCHMTGRLDEALLYAQQAHAGSEQSSNVRIKVKAKEKLADVLIGLCRFSEVNELAESINSLAQLSGKTIYQAVSMHLLAKSYWQAGDYVKSHDILLQCLSLLEQDWDNNKNNISMTLGALAMVNQNIGNYSQSLSYFLQSQELAVTLGLNRQVVLNLGNIGIAYWNLKEYDQALQYFSKAIDMAEQMGYTDLIATNVGNMGIVLKDSGKYSEAQSYLQKAHDMSKRLGNLPEMSYWMNSIAEVHNKMGMVDLAYDEFLDILRYRQEIVKTNEGISHTLNNIGEVLIQKGKIEAGLAKFKEALDSAQVTSEKKLLAHINKNIAEVYESQGDTPLALTYYKQYFAISMEMFNDESRKKLESFNVSMAMAEKQKERDIEIMKRKNLEKELSMTAMHLAMQTELLGNFRDELRQIVREIDEPIEALKKIKEKLKTLPCEQIDWVKFEKEFTDIHPEFKTRLLEKYPDLTKQEVKMCQLARLGLKNYETAKLLCLSERSVETHRHNLRKKLMMKPDQNLTAFLSAIA